MCWWMLRVSVHSSACSGSVGRVSFGGHETSWASSSMTACLLASDVNSDVRFPRRSRALIEGSLVPVANERGKEISGPRGCMRLVGTSLYL